VVVASALDMFEEIQTDRLILRALVSDDAPRIFEYRSSPEVSRFQSWGTDSARATESYILALTAIEPGTPGPWYQIGIGLSPTELIGDCGFRVLENEPHHAEIGIALAPEFQNRGYATEALRTLLQYLLVKLGKHRAFGSVDPSNLASIRLLQRIGMREEVRFEKSLWFKGEWVDEVIFAMLAADWKVINQSGRRPMAQH
jgi:RimJ/RimL family protein N-acetyltransferase